MPCQSHKLILIAGIPASGKTRYGLHLSEIVELPFFSKDAFKKHLHGLPGDLTSLWRRGR